MYTANNYRATSLHALVRDATRSSDRDLSGDWSEPEELESWTVEEVKDFLPSHDTLAMDEFEVPWRQGDSFAQMYGLAD